MAARVKKMLAPSAKTFYRSDNLPVKFSPARQVHEICDQISSLALCSRSPRPFILLLLGFLGPVKSSYQPGYILHHVVYHRNPSHHPRDGPGHGHAQEWSVYQEPEVSPLLSVFISRLTRLFPLSRQEMANSQEGLPP